MIVRSLCGQWHHLHVCSGKHNAYANSKNVSPLADFIYYPWNYATLENCLPTLNLMVAKDPLRLLQFKH